MKPYDASAIGSDIARSRTQSLARTCASWVVSALGLNRPSFFATELVQQIQPVCTIPTRGGPLRCVGGHGRLRWRALTFYTEEPQTIAWLDGLTSGDLLWDVGANVGLYAIYAAKLARCKVLAIEPEAQNYAILLENLALNQVQGLVEATNLAITSRVGMGRLHVHALTKGGAYNQFSLADADGDAADRPSGAGPVTQVQLGVSLNDLVTTFAFPSPTHVKIDVDGHEPEILEGAWEVLRHPRCRSVLIEVQQNDPRHLQMVRRLQELGYRCTSQRSNWESRTNRQREREHPATNMIFAKGDTAR